MRVLSVLLFTVTMWSLLTGCALMDRNLFFRDKSVNVVSCPSNVELIVNGQSCVTPCNLSLPDNTANITVSRYGQSTVVPLKQNNMHSYSLNGTLIVMDPSKLGGASDATVYFLRDFNNVADICGTAAGSIWIPTEEYNAEVIIVEDEEDLPEEEGEDVPDIEPITTLPKNPEPAEGAKPAKPAEPAPTELEAPAEPAEDDIGQFIDPALGVSVSLK